MAVQEVAKHGKKAFGIWRNKEIAFWHKLRDLFIEMVIIVLL